MVVAEKQSSDRPLRLLDQVALFNYVTIDHAPTYRAIVEVLYEAKQHYVIELRMSEILERIRSAGYAVEAHTDEALEYHLGRLVEWQNLLRAHDTASVSRIEDFYRKGYLYHLTSMGEAAHRAVLEVEATVGKAGSLQATMLVKIRDALRALANAASGEALDASLLFRLLHDLFAAFDTLSEEANRFIGELNRHVDGERLAEDRFVLHKQAILIYIGRFVEQLRQLAPEIEAGVDAVSGAGIERVLSTASEATDLPPGFGESDPRALWRREHHQKWSGVASWFTRTRPGDAPTIERLADVAVEAVVGLTRTLARFNDRRTRPVDRAADFRTLARWFSACESDEQAHRLWHAAFGLHSARHFHIAEADAEATGPLTSWWESQPVEVPVRLRTRGNVSRAGRPAPVADHTRGKEWIAQRRRRERAQLEAALRRFATGEPIPFTDFATLDASEFSLLLGLLDRVLSSRRRADGSRRGRTADGRIDVTLHPPSRTDDRSVILRSPRGALRCRNYHLVASDTAASARNDVDRLFTEGGE